MDDCFERFETDFELSADLLDRLRGLARGAKVSGRVPLLTCRDSKNKVTMSVVFDETQRLQIDRSLLSCV